MVLEVTVAGLGNPASEVVNFFGPQLARGVVPYFPDVWSQSHGILLSGSTIVQEEIFLPVYVFDVQTFYFLASTQTRREAMLEVLRRLKALKVEMRQKYGEFNIDDDLDEMRNQRLAELG